MIKNSKSHKKCELDRQIKSFCDFLIFEKHFSNNTVASYSRDLLIFKEYFDQNKDKNFLTLNHEDILAFLENLYNFYIESSVSRLLSCLRSFYKFLLREDIVKKNPFAEIKNPLKPKNMIEILDVDETKNFLDRLPHATKLETRNKAMFELIYSSGMRVSEIINLKLNDIDYEENLIRCIGKGNKERIIPAGETAIHYLKVYIKSARLELQGKKSAKSSEFVFLNKNGTKITRQGFWKIMKKYAKQLNLNKNIYPHLFRHSYATHMLERGADLRIVQELLGHSSISSTEIYTNINRKFIKDSFFRHHPRK
ncbi:MAG: tyrosine recombinase [Actinobacteria bacterium]|nr:tyrosine recombinase [Cyanobacteriota bacterium]MCL6087895.1 tyrosine recombinase [Actinomycetota bacterium]